LPVSFSVRIIYRIVSYRIVCKLELAMRNEIPCRQTCFKSFVNFTDQCVTQWFCLFYFNFASFFLRTVIVDSMYAS